jgi:hypothetical protein
MTRAGLHALIDQIPDADVAPTAALLEALRTHDRTLVQALLTEEEPLEPEDAQALAEVDRTDTIAGEEVERRFGRA